MQILYCIIKYEAYTADNVAKNDKNSFGTSKYLSILLSLCYYVLQVYAYCYLR